MEESDKSIFKLNPDGSYYKDEKGRMILADWYRADKGSRGKKGKGGRK